MDITLTTIQNVLTRATGFLSTVASHSLQPYCGCPFGNASCGVGCYVRHNGRLTRGRPWGSFLEVRTNAAESYKAGYRAERNWARAHRERFTIFLSSSTEPFPPQEARFGVTRSVLEAMCEFPPDGLILQTHSHGVAAHLDVIADLARRCDLRVHISIETDRERMPGLPPHPTPIERRFEAAAALKQAGIRVVVTVSPLLPIADPDAFFKRIADVADAVVLDHFIGGDGSPQGTRTQTTALPAAMAAIDPTSVELAYRDRMAEVARCRLPGRVGLHIDGFAGRNWT